MTLGAFGPPDIYPEAKVAQEVAIRKSKDVVVQGFQEFGDIFGRHYLPVEPYKTRGARTLLVTMGSFGETAKTVIDTRKDKGESVGLINLRLWRPFPFEELRQAVKGARTLIVFDRCISFGGPAGPVSSEIKAALYDEKERPEVVSFVGGLGGRDMSVKDFEYVIDRGREIAEKGSNELYETVGIRGKVAGIRG